MPDIVKYKYVPPLLEALAEAKEAGMSDEEFVEHMNAPQPTGEVEVVAVEPDAGRLAEAIRNAEDLRDLQRRVAAATEERPVMGPSRAQALGIGRLYPENVAQLRGYVGLSEDGIREDLARRLASEAVREVRD